VSPSRITLRQKPPRSLRAFAEAFGTERIDFDAPADTLTLRTADLNLPLPTADPALAQIVQRYATMMATPLLCEPTWPDECSAHWSTHCVNGTRHSRRWPAGSP